MKDYIVHGIGLRYGIKMSLGKWGVKSPDCKSNWNG